VRWRSKLPVRGIGYEENLCSGWQKADFDLSERWKSTLLQLSGYLPDCMDEKRGRFFGWFIHRENGRDDAIIAKFIQLPGKKRADELQKIREFNLINCRDLHRRSLQLISRI
jgi:hypothetical protein